MASALQMQRHGANGRFEAGVLRTGTGWRAERAEAGLSPGAGTSALESAWSSRTEEVMSKRLLFIAMGAALAASIAFAYQSSEKVTIPVTKTAPTSGQQMFTNYCAPCHGVDGRGQGPVAPVLKTPPPDLTLLSRNNKGKYPGTRVVTVLENGPSLPAHGSAQMPVWGPIFGKMNVSNRQEKMLRISNLSGYLETLQVK